MGRETTSLDSVSMGNIVPELKNGGISDPRETFQPQNHLISTQLHDHESMDFAGIAFVQTKYGCLLSAPYTIKSRQPFPFSSGHIPLAFAALRRCMSAEHNLDCSPFDSLLSSS